MKEKNKKATKEDINGALIKKALGYDVNEVVEEYATDENGKVTLTKKKVTKKNVPPDLSALKILMDGCLKINELTDEELEQEKQRLLNLLSELNKGKKNE